MVWFVFILTVLMVLWHLALGLIGVQMLKGFSRAMLVLTTTATLFCLSLFALTMWRWL